MMQIRKIPLVIFTLNVLVTILMLSISFYTGNNQKITTQLSISQQEQSTSAENNLSSLTFENIFIANQLLQQLDVFSTIGPEDPYDSPSPSQYFSGLKKDNDYCNKHRAFFVQNSSFIFEEKNFLADEARGHLLRKTTIPSIGADVHKEVIFSMNSKLAHRYDTDIRPEVNIFFTNRRMHGRMALGKQFSCLTQISNHIPNFGKLNRKDRVGEALVEYTKNYSTRPSCFNNNKFFPQTWVLYNKEQCKEFFEEFNSPQYIALKEERGIVYFRKIGANVHEGKGVFPVNDQEEKSIKALYKNGALCGQVKDNNIMQHFIHNPLLLEGRKFDFRVFMLIASTNPMIVFYHDGYLRLSLHKYDSTSQEKGALLTNTALSKPIFKEAKEKGTYNGLTAEEIKEQSYWLYPQLFQYLREQGKVTDPNWIENHLKNEIKKAMVHLIRMSQDSATKKSCLFELEGVDFMMDADLDLWFIEVNSKPLIQGWTAERNEFFNKLLTDSFEIVFGLLKSRTKRIINYINYITTIGDAWSYADSTIEIKELDLRREEFRKLSMNKFELEFEPSAKNGFEKIIDENYFGAERYMNIIDEDCI